MNENKDYNTREKMYDIMNTTQSNYSNMLKRLQRRKMFSQRPPSLTLSRAINFYIFPRKEYFLSSLRIISSTRNKR